MKTYHRALTWPFPALLVIVLCLSGGCGDPPAERDAEQPARPNVIVFLADDMGWADVGYHGSEIHTPNLDRLAASGLRLRRFYTSPKCTPTRARLLTGRWAHRYNLLHNVRPRTRRFLPVSETTLAERLGAEGYQTAVIGKWHLGREAGHLPADHGFDHHYGIHGGWIDHFTHERQGQLDWYRNGEPLREPGYTTNLLAREAVRWLRDRDRSAPFFLYVPFTVPHPPLQAPDDLLARYDGIEDPKRRTFAAMVTGLDRAVGRVLAVLEDEGSGDDTLVVFFFDNGADPRFGGSNEPFRGAKWQVLEGGVRVPALMSWPGTLPKGKVSDQLLSNVDLAPTILAATGSEVPAELDGRDLLPALMEGRSVPRGPLFLADEGAHWIRTAVVDWPWKLTRALRKDDRAIEQALYDLEADPREADDLAAENPERVEKMRQELETWWNKGLESEKWPLGRRLSSSH